MKKTHCLSSVAATLLLTGCLNHSQVGLDLMNQGNYQLAYDVFARCAGKGDSYCINNIGVMYQNGHMQGGVDVERAAEYFTLAARYGNATAIQNLGALGRPVPAPDLMYVQQQQQQAQLQMANQLGAAIGSAIAGNPGGGVSGGGGVDPQPAQMNLGRTAYWTGASMRVTTITNQYGINCEYSLGTQKFWQTFVGGLCPSSVQAQ